MQSYQGRKITSLFFFYGIALKANFVLCGPDARVWHFGLKKLWDYEINVWLCVEMYTFYVVWRCNKVWKVPEVGNFGAVLTRGPEGKSGPLERALSRNCSVSPVLKWQQASHKLMRPTFCSGYFQMPVARVLETGSIAKVKEIACLPRQNWYIFSKVIQIHIQLVEVSWIQLVLKINVDTKYFHKYRYFNTIINIYSSIIQPHFGHCWWNQGIIYWLEINTNWFIRMYQFLTKLWAQDFYEM